MKANTPMPALLGYLARIGAVQKNFRKYVVEEDDPSGYKRTVATIRIDEGELTCDKKQYAPNDDEAPKIKLEIAGAEFPKSITATLLNKENLRASLAAKGDPGELFVFRDDSGDGVLFIEQRFKIKGERVFLPWSFWSDVQWRNMVPDGKLPFWRPPHRKKARLMIHEGARKGLRTKARPMAI